MRGRNGTVAGRRIEVRVRMITVAVRRIQVAGRRVGVAVRGIGVAVRWITAAVRRIQVAGRTVGVAVRGIEMVGRGAGGVSRDSTARSHLRHAALLFVIANCGGGRAGCLCARLFAPDHSSEEGAEVAVH